MIHEHQLELAAAALDFDLMPAERSRLDTAIAECSVCAGAAAAYRRQATLLQALPVVDASPAVRGHVERAAGLRPQRTSWTWVFLAAALLGLLVTSVLVAGASHNRPNPLVDLAPTPTPAESPSANQPSPDVIALDPPSGELANVGPPLGHDSLALVVTDNLRVRSAPFVGDLSIRHKRLLQPDDRLFVVDGPVIAQNYEWYQVKAWRPSQPSISWPVGWVARAGHDGEVWLRASTVGCPSAPLDIAALLELAPVERLGCVRDDPIEVRGVIVPGAADCDIARAGCATGPESVAGPALMVGTSSTGSASMGIAFALDPAASVGMADLEGAGVVRLRGAFDDPKSAMCRPDADRPGPDGPLSPVDAVLSCRGRFVVSHVTIEPFPRLADVSTSTVSDRLRVRSLPEISDASARYEPLLPLGSRVQILDGPVLGDGYVWYHVKASVNDPNGAPRSLTGWVAAAGKDGERWLDVTGPSPSASVAQPSSGA